MPLAFPRTELVFHETALRLKRPQKPSDTWSIREHSLLHPYSEAVGKMSSPRRCQAQVEERAAHCCPGSCCAAVTGTETPRNPGVPMNAESTHVQQSAMLMRPVRNTKCPSAREGLLVGRAVVVDEVAHAGFAGAPTPCRGCSQRRLVRCIQRIGPSVCCEPHLAGHGAHGPAGGRAAGAGVTRGGVQMRQVLRACRRRHW